MRDYDPRDWFDSFDNADLAGLASRESFSCLDSEPDFRPAPTPPLPDGKAASPLSSSQPSSSLGSRQCRDDPSKLLFQLIPPEAEEALARALSYGTKKYAPRNWEKGLPWSETIGSLRRHLNAFMKGETHDDESGLLHTDLLICNAAFLCTMVARRPDLNDLPWSTHANPTD